MSDMYKWLDIVKQGMQMAAKAGEREARQAATEFSDDTAARASVYTGEIEQQQHIDLDNDEHAISGKPDLQPGQTVIIDQLYGPGAGHGVFVAYALDGQSAICNVDSINQTIPIEFVTRAQSDIRKAEFQSTGSEGAMSPLTNGEKNRADIKSAQTKTADYEEEEDTPKQKDSQMEDLEKWMRIIEEGPDLEKEFYAAGDAIGANLDAEQEAERAAARAKLKHGDSQIVPGSDEDKIIQARKQQDKWHAHNDAGRSEEKRFARSVKDLQNTKEGYTVMPSIDRERYTDLSGEGLEGPFMTKSGKVVYYDPREGKYYDRDSDFYISHEEYAAMNESACGCASYDCTSCFPMNEATEVADEEDADSEFDTVIDVNEGVNGEYPDYGSYPVEVENGQLPGIPAGTYNLMFDADVRVLGKYYPATRYEPAEYPEAEVEVTYVALWDTKSESDDPIITSNDSPKVQQELFSLVPNNAIEELEQDALEPKDDDDYDDGGYDQDADWGHFADSKQPTKAPMNESKTLKGNKMKLKEFGVRDAAKIAGTVAGDAVGGPIGGAAGGYAAGKIADKVIGSNEVDEDDEYEIEPTPQVAETDEWEEDPINGFGAADELDDVESDSNELSGLGAHGASADVSELIGVIDHIQSMGMSMSDRHYDVDKLIGMRPEMIKRIYDKVKGVEEAVREADDDFEPEDDEYAGLDREAADMTGDAARSAGVDLSSDKPAPVSNYYNDDGAEWGDDDADASLSDVGDEIDGTDEPEVEVPTARARGASMDVSDMLGKIAYMQDMGMSLSDRHYDTEKLMMMDPEMIQRVYGKVVGESKRPSSDMFMSTLSESKKTKQPISEGADPDVVRALKALFD